MTATTPTQEFLTTEGPIPAGGHRLGGIRALTRNSAVAMAGGVISQGLKFFVVVYLARVLSVSEFGRVSFAIAVNAYMFIIAHFGLPVFGSRVVATTGVVPRGLLFEIACLRACLALASMLVGVGVLFLAPGVSRTEILMVGIFGLSNILQAGIFDWVFQGLHRQEISAVLNCIWQGGWLVLTVLGIHLGMGVLSVPAGLAGGALIAAIAGYFWLRRTVEIGRGDNDQVNVFRRSWDVLKLGAPLGWGTLLVTMLIWSDTLVVRLAGGQVAVGLYAAGNRPALALAMLSSFYVQGAFPMLSQAAQTGPSFLNRYFQHCYEDMALVFVPGSLWAIFYARDILLLVFKNSEYLAATPIFRIFQVTFLLAALGNLIGIAALVATHRDRDYQKVLVLATCAFLPVCVLLTVWAGNLGASIAALSAQALALVLFGIKARGVLQPRHLDAIFKPLLAGVLVGGISRAIGFGLIASAGLLLLAYTALFALRSRVIFQTLGSS
jgi:O-antigen/teichoic acid export membrane protein